MDAPDLLPCPFCGCIAYVREDASHSTGYFIGCATDSCVGEMHWGQTKSDAIAAWNRRVMTDPKVKALVMERDGWADLAVFYHTREGAADRIEALAAVIAERDALRDEVKAYLGAWAGEYARRTGLPDGHLHPQHFDRMAELGCRMDSFTRAKLEAQNG